MNRRLRRLARFLPLGLLLLPGCDLFKYERPFPDQYYSTNFISTIGFDQFVGDEGTVPDPAATGSWDCAYRYAPGWGGYDYVTLAPLGAQTANDYLPVPAGLDPAALVYRLELDNLAIDGDFEAGNGGIWTVSTGASVNRTEEPPSSGAYLMSLTAGASEYVEWTPSLEGAAGGMASYLFTMNVSVTSPDSGKILLNTEEKETVTTTTSFTASEPSISPFVFRFQPPTAETNFTDLRIDNARLTMPSGSFVRLWLTRSQTTLALEPGIYEFSVWVHEDLSVVPGEDPYALDSITIKAKSLKGFQNTKSMNYALSGTGWRKLTATLNTLQFDKVGLLPTDPILEIGISLEGSGSGRVLIAQPELRFID